MENGKKIFLDCLPYILIIGGATIVGGINGMGVGIIVSGVCLILKKIFLYIGEGL